MFVGSINQDLRSFVSEVTRQWDCSDIYIGCSGNFTIERILKDRDFKLHGNDVSMYTNVIGNYLAGNKMEIRVIHPDYMWLEPYMEDEVDRIATLLLCTTMLENMERDEPYFTRQRQAYYDQWETLHAGTKEKVLKGIEDLRMTSYWEGDVVEFVQGAPKDQGVISFPPTYCLHVDEKILTKNLEWVRVGDITENQKLLAFDEYPQEGKRCRRWQDSKVTYSKKEKKESVKVYLENGEEVICSKDHPWLVDRYPYNNAGGHRNWKRADEIEGHYALKHTKMWEKEESYDAGWLSGMLDGEGSLHLGKVPKLTITQQKGEVSDRIIRILEERNFKLSYSEKRKDIVDIYIGGGFPETLRALGTFRPIRLLEKFKKSNFSHLAQRAQGNSRVKIIKVEDVGEQEIQSISTSTKTYIGNGYLMHNTGGYEKLYESFESVFDWEEPEYEMFDDYSLDIMVERVKENKYWLMARDEPINLLEGYEVGRVQTSPRSKPVIVYSNMELSRITMPRQKTEQVKIPRMNENTEITKESVLSLKPISQGQMNTLRSLYLDPSIAPAAAMVNLAVLVDGKLIGGLGVTKAQFGSGIYMMTDFAIRPLKYKRASKLVLAAAISREMKLISEQLINQRVRAVTTTAFTDKPVSMKYRGIFELESRKEDPPRLNYGSEMGRWNLQEALEWWVDKHGNKTI